MSLSKILFFASIFIGSQIIFAQEPNFVNASHFADIKAVDFDDQNARYVSITVKGRIKVNGENKDYPTYGKLIGKMASEGNFSWVIELEKTPRDFKLVGRYLYIIEQEKEKTDDQTIYSVYLRKFALDGQEVGKKILINKTSGPKYKVFSDARIYDSGIVVWSSLKGKTNEFTIDGEKYQKTLYSTINLKSFSLSGQENWSYQFAGGVDGYTELRLQGMTLNNDGDLIAACYYGAKAKIGENEFTSELLFDEGGQKLYVDEVVLLKLNNEGKLVKAKEIAEYTLDIEEIIEGSDGTIYMVGYHKGNETFASSADDPRPYRGMRFMGEYFQYSKEETLEAEVLKEDCFMAALDANWNPKWTKNLKGMGDNRLSHIVETAEGLVVSGGFSKNITINGTTYDVHVANKGYLNSFVAKVSKDGEIGEVTTFKSPKTTMVEIYLDQKGKVVVVSGFKQNNLYINDKSYLLPDQSIYAGFFYYM